MVLKGVVESLLFVSDAPVSLDRICTLAEEYGRDEIKGALEELMTEYSSSGRGIELVQVAGGYQLRSRGEYADFIRRLKRAKPVTWAEVEYLRGVDSGGVLNSLLDKKLIRILGKKDIPGKPLIYGTTREF